MLGMLRRAGLEDVRFRPFVVGFTSEDPMANFKPPTAASMRQAILEAGLMSEAECFRSGAGSRGGPGAPEAEVLPDPCPGSFGTAPQSSCDIGTESVLQLLVVIRF